MEKSKGKKRPLKFLLLLIPVFVYLILALQYSNLGNVHEDEKQFYRDDNGVVYPQGADSYLFYKQAADLSLGRAVKNASLLQYIYYSVYNLGKIFSRAFSVISAVYYAPLIFGVLSIILIFLVARKAFGETTGFIASFLFSIHYIMLEIFQAGYGDQENLNVMLSLLFIFLLFKAMESFENKSGNKTAIFGILTVLSAWLFAFAWGGYYYIILITLAFLVAYFLLKLYRKKDYKKLIILIIAICLLLLIALVFFRQEISGSRLYLRLFTPKSSYGYPDWSYRIEELRSSDFKMVLAYSGGWALLIAMLLGIAYLAKEAKSFLQEDKNAAFRLYIIIYFIASFVGVLLATKAQVYFAFVSIILASAGISYLCKIISRLINAKISKKTSPAKAEIALIIIVLIALAIFLVPKTLRSVNAPPLMEDSVYLTAKGIRENSSENAVVTSWWDEGHFYNAFTDRKVTVKAYPEPRIMYLLAKAMATNDENLSMGIFKILNCGNAYDPLISQNLSLAIEKTGCNASQHFLILSSWVKKYAALIYDFGNWNFESQKSDFDMTVRPIGEFEKCQVYADSINCGENYVIDRKNMEAMYKGRQVSFAYASNSTVMLKDRKSNYILILYRVGSGYETVAVRKDILDTMLVRLYFLNGIGLQHFRKFSEITANKRTVAYEILYD